MQKFKVFCVAGYEAIGAAPLVFAYMNDQEHNPPKNGRSKFSQPVPTRSFF